MQNEERILCLFCLKGDARLKIDKHGRPYVTCGYCGTRSFMASFDALNGYRMLAPSVVALVARFGSVEATIASNEARSGFMEAAGAAGGAR